MKQIANVFADEYDQLQRENNQVVLTEGGARLQIMKDKIFLCNDDKDQQRIQMGQLDSYQEEVINEFRQQVTHERDMRVHKIEEMLNMEVKQNNKELKRRQKLENEFKSMNKKNCSTMFPGDIITSRQTTFKHGTERDLKTQYSDKMAVFKNS